MNFYVLQHLLRFLQHLLCLIFERDSKFALKNSQRNLTEYENTKFNTNCKRTDIIPFFIARS